MRLSLVYLRCLGRICYQLIVFNKFQYFEERKSDASHNILPPIE